MGAPDLKPTELRPIEPHAFSQGALDEEMAKAAKNRPDLRALGQAQSAQASAVGAAKSDFGPRVSAYGNWEEDQSSIGGSGGNNWVAEVQISVDILPLGKRGQLARESAAKQKIDAQVAATQQHLRLEVSQAHIHQQTAALQLEMARAAMDQSAESLRILKNRYSAGLRLHRARLAVRKEMSRSLGGDSDEAFSKKKARGRTKSVNREETKRPAECRELFLNLSEYLDQRIEPRTCEQMREHIEACPACVSFLRDLRGAIDRCRSLQVPCDSAVQPRLRAILTQEFLRLIGLPDAKRKSIVL